MKLIYTILLLTSTFISVGQNDNPDFDNLVKLGEIYSKNVNARGDSFKKSIEVLRTPGLNHIVDALMLLGEGDKKLLTKQFLSKPSEQELKYWYVIREIHYNNQSKDTEPKPNEQVAAETLEKDIDSRWLVDNYYYRLHSGIAMLFNDKNLSKYDINLDEFGLETETEKAILYVEISSALIQRFRVLLMMKNYDKLLDFARKLPTFNGKPYYEYTAFNFEDFEWIGYDKTESYKEKNMSDLYSALYGHFSALTDQKRTEEARKLYFNSILSMPEYFKYSGELEKGLSDLYNQSKK